MPKYILLDTETTGFDEKDRIIQLGYMVLDGRNVEVVNEFCQSDTPISIGAMETHNITPEMIQNKPKCVELEGFKKLLKLNVPENYLIIHNAKFDLQMLQKEGFENRMQLIDTLKVARHLLPDEEAHRLQYFRYKLKLYQKEADEAKKLGIEVKAHDAIGDVLVLKLLLTELRKLILQNFPNEDSVKKMVELTNTPVFIPKMKMGKYRGELLVDIAKKDKNYLEWALNNMDKLDEDARYSIKKVLDEST